MSPRLPMPAPLPAADDQGHVTHDGARIWYASFGDGAPIILLHGGLGNGEDWGNQVPALVESGRRVVLIDSRGHGRSSRDAQAFHYERMATDVVAVMDHLRIEKSAVLGWSDGAILALLLAMKHAERVTKVIAFGGNADLTGVKDVSPTDPLIAAVIERAKNDYARLSDTPTEFKAMSSAVFEMMRTEPSFTASELGAIRVPVTIFDGDADEFIKREHLEYVARAIPGAQLIFMSNAGHYAPLQAATRFNAVVIGVLQE